MPYRVQIARAAERDLTALSPAFRARVAVAIDALADNPRPRGAIKLTDRPGFRLRLGSYRVMYEIADAQSLVTVTRVLHRRDAYR